MRSDGVRKASGQTPGFGLFISRGWKQTRRFRAILSVAMLAVSARAEASTWALQPNASRVEFSVRNLSVASVHGGFHLVSGTVQLNDDDVSRSTVEAVIDATSIDTDEPKRDAHLRSPDFLDVGAYPTIAFRSTRVESTGDDRWKVTGQLTLRGRTREVVLDVQGATVNGDRATAHASTTIDRRDFGITYSGFAVGKAVAITIDTVATRTVD